MIDSAQPMRSVLEISDHAFGDVKLDAVAVVPRLAGDDTDAAVVIDFADAAQHFAQNRGLAVELILVTGVLILAAAAVLEVGAEGRDARSGRLDDLEQMGARQIVFDAVHPGVHGLARQHERSEDHLAVDPR